MTRILRGSVTGSASQGKTSNIDTQKRSVIIDIPELLKEPMLNHLQKQHDISTKTVYNDLHGFIRNQSIHQGTYIEVYKSETAEHKDFLLQDRS